MNDLVNSNEKQTNSLGSTSEKVRAVMVAIKQQWPNAQIDFRDPAGIWSQAIDPLNTAEISYGIKALRFVTKDFALTPAQFREYAKAYSPPDPKPEKPIAVGERETAKQACNGAYANRIMNHLGLEIPLAAQKYAGQFDFKSVAYKAPLPPVDNHKHKPFWEAMWQEFDQAWSGYASK